MGSTKSDGGARLHTAISPAESNDLCAIKRQCQLICPLSRRREAIHVGPYKLGMSKRMFPFPLGASAARLQRSPAALSPYAVSMRDPWG